MIGQTCPRCGTIHALCDTTAVDRFNPAGPAGYRGKVPDAPLRATRAEALQGVCDQRNGVR